MLGLINIPELHLLIGNPGKSCSRLWNKDILGVVDKIILEFERRVFDSPELGRKWMDGFLKKVEFGFYFLL